MSYTGESGTNTTVTTGASSTITVGNSTESAIPEWIARKLSDVEKQRYRILQSYCSTRKDGHAVILHQHMNAVMAELSMNTYALMDLSRLGVIKLVLNGNSTEIAIVE